MPKPLTSGAKAEGRFGKQDFVYIRERIAADTLARLFGHFRELITVMADVGDFMRHDQVVPCIDRGLHVVADNPGALATGRHRPRVGIGK